MIDSNDAKLLWDYSTQSNREMKAPRPDIVLLDK